MGFYFTNFVHVLTALHTSAAKLSKSLLSSSPHSIPLWAAHCRVERLRKRHGEARKVYETVLGSAQPGQANHSLLWWDWAEMEWNLGQADLALGVVLRAGGSHGSGGTAILRAKKQLEEFWEKTPEQSWKERECWVKLRCLLELLTGAVNNALTSLDSKMALLGEDTEAHESLSVASLMILFTHSVVLQNPVPPALLRDRAEQALHEYPNNSIILAIFLESQKGQGVWGRVKALFGEQTGTLAKEKDVSRRVAEIWVAGWEGGRWEAEQERTRNGLSLAVSEERYVAGFSSQL